MRFEEYVDISSSFQHSININLDINNIEKVNSYIPTTASIQFMNYYIDSICGKNKSSSTMLIAPYGKGKSHAILVLLSLISHENLDDYEVLLNKIRVLDENLVLKIKSLNRNYLPVIISYSSGSLTSSLMRALKRAVITIGLDPLIIKTDYTSAIERIEGWKEKYPKTYADFLTELKNKKIREESFIESLLNYEEESLLLFGEIHREILSGAEYVPYNLLEPVEYYKEVLVELKRKTKCTGMFIVFDEFSKFLESREEVTVGSDMKIIQDLAELSNNEKDMFLQLVLHKPSGNYTSMSKVVKNAFKGIEGRVNSYFFTTSVLSSYELIFDVVKNNANYDRYYTNNKAQLNSIAKSIAHIPAIVGNFGKGSNLTDIINDCFPLHPLTIYMLIKLNEKVAQNERTLFTFLASDSKDTLKDLIAKEYSGILVKVPAIFDYFKQLLLDEKDNVTIHKITSNALSALDQNVTMQETEIIKTLAVLLILNEKEVLPTNSSIIADSLMLPHSQCASIISNLKEKGILIERNGGLIEFKINMNLDVTSIINDLSNTKFVHINTPKELGLIVDNKYVYPRTYNISSAITRYFRIEYITQDDFMQLESVANYFTDFRDGTILNIIRTHEDCFDIIRAKVFELNELRLIVVYPKNHNQYESQLKNLLAIRSMLDDHKFVDDNKLVKKELELLYDDTKESLIFKLDNDYGLISKTSSVINVHNDSEISSITSSISMNRLLHTIMSDTFYLSPVINLELINRNSISGGYSKARIKACDKLLNDAYDFSFLGTTPEDTIVNCTLVETGLSSNTAQENLNNVINYITEFINVGNGCFSDLYNTLMAAPYGMRKGVLPVLIAYVINNNRYKLILKYKSKELGCTGKDLCSIEDSPKDYSFFLDVDSEEKRLYIESLRKLFYINDSISDNVYELILRGIQKWYNALPKLTQQMIGEADNMNSKSFKKFHRLCKMQNVNASEYVLQQIPLIFDEPKADIISKLNEMKSSIDNYLNSFISDVSKVINETLGYGTDTSVARNCIDWISENQNQLSTKVLDSATSRFITSYDIINNKDDAYVTDKIAQWYTGLFITDWSKSTLEMFIGQLNIVNNYMNIQDSESKNSITLHIDGKTVTKCFEGELDGSEEMLENMILENFDSFGEILSNEQKIGLLVKIMEKFL